MLQNEFFQWTLAIFTIIGGISGTLDLYDRFARVSYYSKIILLYSLMFSFIGAAIGWLGENATYWFPYGIILMAKLGAFSGILKSFKKHIFYGMLKGVVVGIIMWFVQIITVHIVGFLSALVNMSFSVTVGGAMLWGVSSLIILKLFFRIKKQPEQRVREESAL